MAESYPEIVEGPLDSEATVIDAVANGAVAQWAPVALVAAGTGETLPRVGTTTNTGDKDVYGVKVGPNKTLAAGEIAQIVVRGRCKCKVLGAASTIARGTALETSTTAGQARGQAALDAPGSYVEATVQTELDKIAAAFATSLEAASADGDIVAVEVHTQSVK